MNIEEIQKDNERSKKIDKQVERWDLFAKIAPTIFLIVCLILLLTESVTFEQVFSIGMILFALTAVTWWFWAIFSIRFLVKTISRARHGLIEVTYELKEARKELRELIDDENNNS